MVFNRLIQGATNGIKLKFIAGCLPASFMSRMKNMG
jgi:hypothetical protein